MNSNANIPAPPVPGYFSPVPPPAARKKTHIAAYIAAALTVVYAVVYYVLSETPLMFITRAFNAFFPVSLAIFVLLACLFGYKSKLNWIPAAGYSAAAVIFTVQRYKGLTQISENILLTGDIQHISSFLNLFLTIFLSILFIPVFFAALGGGRTVAKIFSVIALVFAAVGLVLAYLAYDSYMYFFISSIYIFRSAPFSYFLSTLAAVLFAWLGGQKQIPVS